MSDSTEKTAAHWIAMVLLYPWVLLYQLWAYGFVLAKLWAWHVAPALHVPMFAWHQFGVAVLISFFFRTGRYDKYESDRVKVLGWWLFPWTALFLGWLLR